MRIATKWGFGNAPLKASTRETTHEAIRRILEFLERPDHATTVEEMDAISYVKGQFSRTVKQDQWDWFTVWDLLGRPSRRLAIRIASDLASLRRALKLRLPSEAQRIKQRLVRIGIERHLRDFLTGESDRPTVAGFIYILSTRLQPRLLKIGMTTRTVPARAKEINSATGVVVPYGARASWAVSHAAEAERRVHAMLCPYRVRRDREFFEMDYIDACDLIETHLREQHLLLES